MESIPQEELAEARTHASSSRFSKRRQKTIPFDEAEAGQVQGEHMHNSYGLPNARRDHCLPHCALKMPWSWPHSRGTQPLRSLQQLGERCLSTATQALRFPTPWLG